MTWTAQAHDRQGWWNADAEEYADLREQIIAECKAGRLWGPLYITRPDGTEHDMTVAYLPLGLRPIRDRPEPLIDEDEEAEE